MIRGMLAYQESQGRVDSKGTRVFVAYLGCRVLVENMDHRANLVKRALMVYLDLLAQRVFQVTLAHQDRTAPKDPRESKGLEVCQVREEHLDSRVMRDPLGLWDPLDSRAGLGGRDSLD